MFDKYWRLMALKAEVVAGLVFVGGFLLFGFALYLGLNSVQFDGHFKGGAALMTPEGAPAQVVKEVGFFYAPNWLLTGLILLPLALLYLFRTRVAIEPLIIKLVERGMLVRVNGARANEAEVLALWQRHSGWWSNVATCVFVATVAFTVIADFIPVVWNWNLSSPEVVSAFITDNAMTLGHPTYEFDWSVASTFANSKISGWVNVTFGFFAYLLIPLIGSATMFSAMIWLFSTHGVFNANSLAAEGYKLLPDVMGSDDRCGFELFEEFFDNLVRATFITALIVVSMHLQNVYLRAPDQANIIDMVFGDDLGTLGRNLAKGDFAEIIRNGLGLQDAWRTLGSSATEFSAQTYIAVVALMMLAVILFGMVWGWLRTSAIRGQDEMIAALADERYRLQREKLETMKVWPIGWAGINIIIASVVIVAGSMVWPNFLYLVVALLVVAAITGLISYIKDSVADIFRRSERRRRLKAAKPEAAAEGRGVVLPADLVVAPTATMPGADDDSYVERRSRSAGGAAQQFDMLIPGAALMEGHIAAVPFGRRKSLSELRHDMALQFGTEATCPATTQRLLKVIATRSVADFHAGRRPVPFWRVVDPDKPASAKLAGGLEFILARLNDEASD
ncbi:MAG TPA: hypothetical protein VL147_02870 [Devosia sp.]|nr:hypothetical protein [Devosia sp.]